MAVMANAKNPVLAHLYINFLLDAAIAEQNFAWNGLPARRSRGSTPTT